MKDCCRAFVMDTSHEFAVDEDAGRDVFDGIAGLREEIQKITTQLEGIWIFHMGLAARIRCLNESRDRHSSSLVPFLAPAKLDFAMSLALESIW